MLTIGELIELLPKNGWKLSIEIKRCADNLPEIDVSLFHNGKAMGVEIHTVGYLNADAMLRGLVCDAIASAVYSDAINLGCSKDGAMEVWCDVWKKMRNEE